MEYLKTCISSLCGIAYDKVEFIFVDDGSPDDCGEICENYARKDNRIKVYHKKNGGVSSARNYGIKKAEGKYITFVDADDWIEPDKMYTVIQMMLQSNYDIYIHGQYIDFKNKEPVEVRPFDSCRVFTASDEINKLQKMVFVRDYNSMKTCLGAGVLCNATDKIVKKNILEENGCMYDEEIEVSEDGLFNLKVLEYCNSAIYIDLCIYHYRMRRTSACHSVKGTIGYKKIKIFMNKAIEYLQCTEKDTSYYEALYCRCYDLLFEQFETAYLSNAAVKGNLLPCMRMIKKELKEEPFLKVIKTVKIKNLTVKEKVKALMFKLKLAPVFLLIKVIKRRMNFDKKAEQLYY